MKKTFFFINGPWFLKPYFKTKGARKKKFVFLVDCKQLYFVSFFLGCPLKSSFTFKIFSNKILFEVFFL